MAYLPRSYLSMLAWAIVSLPSTSVAAEWVNIGTVDSQFGTSEVEIDTASIRKFTGTRIREEREFQLYSKVRSAWFRISFRPVEIEGQKMSSALMRININCDIDSVQTEAMVVFSGTRGRGRRLASTDSEYRTIWTDIVPESLQDLARQELCTK